jgi:hypothetical protein
LVRGALGVMRGRSWLAKGSVIVAAGALAVGAGIALGDPKPDALGAEPAPIEVQAEPIAAFDKLDPQKARFGKLTWRGGLVLTSPSPNFGGWSGLAVGADGTRLIAVSDAGAWLSGTLVYDDGKPKGIRAARLGPLLAHPGEALTHANDRDAEGISLAEGTPAKGRALISFERNHRMGWFDVDEDGFSPVRGFVAPPAEMKRAKGNQGLESVATLRGGPYKGAVIAIAEQLFDRAGNHTGWIWINGKPEPFHLVNGDGFDITDAAALPDGGLLVLERRFRASDGVATRLRLVKRDELRPGALVKGEILFDAGMNQEIDNMEGLAVHAGADGATIVTIISDDNFNRTLQRTLLLQFALDADGLARADARPARRSRARAVCRR